MIKIDDVIKRSRYLNLSEESQRREYSIYHTKAKLLSESSIYRFDDRKYALQHWQSLDRNQNECLKKVIDILDETFESNNIGDFEYVKNYIVNEVAPVVRDAKQFQKYLKYKTTRMKNKIKERIEKNTDEIKDTTKALVDNVKKTDQQAISTAKTNVKKSLGKEDKKEELHEAYIQILDAVNKYDYCDRILENSYKIQKRFNIMNSAAKTATDNEYALRAYIDSICECVNTYDADYATRLNTSLETCFYFLSRVNRNVNKSIILEEVVDNFISKDFTNNDLLDMKLVIESSMLFDPLTKTNIEFVYNTIPFDENNNIEKVQESMLDLVCDIDALNEGFVSKSKETAKDIVNSFKMMKTKKATDVRTCVSKMFTKSPDQIIDATPNFLSWIRLTYVVGATAIHPVLGGVTLLVDQFIAMHLKRRDVGKMITVFKNERKNVKEKLVKTVDEKDKKNLKEYDRYLEEGAKKLEEYESSLYTDLENDAREKGKAYDRDEEISNIKGEDLDDDDLDNDDDLDDDDFELESTSFEKLFERSNYFSKNYFTDNIKKYISVMNEDTIDTITDIACKYPSIISTNILYSLLDEQLSDIKNAYSNNKDWVRMSCLTSNKRKLDSAKDVITSDDDMCCVFDVINGLEDLFAELSINQTLNPTNESVSTAVKSLSNKLRKTMQKASDADKEASRKIDSSVNMFLSGIQRSVRNENREAIIKGSVLPSASKIVKAAILDTGVALINPALAIILALGQFAVSKKMKKRERQLVLDEIDVEIEMCKRYLRQAEDQNDLEAQKKILRIQRNLERQRQRIVYNMRVHWNDKTPTISDDND